MAASTPRITPRSHPSHSPPLCVAKNHLNPLLDLTYLRKYLPRTISNHRLAQGQLLRRCAILEKHIESTLERVAYLCCRASEGILFALKLKNHPRIHKIEILENWLKIELNPQSESSGRFREDCVQRFHSDPLEKEPEEPYVEQILSKDKAFINRSGQKLSGSSSHPVSLTTQSSSSKSGLSYLTAHSQCSSQASEPRYFHPQESQISYSDLSEIGSSSIRFSELDTNHYLETLQKILQYVSDGILTGQDFLDITLYNIDSLFFTHLIEHLCSDYAEEVKLKPNYTMHLKLKKELDPKESIHAIQALKKEIQMQKAPLVAEKKPASPPNSIKALSFAFLDTCSLFLECSSSPRDAFFSASKALARFKIPAGDGKLASPRGEVDYKSHFKPPSRPKETPEGEKPIGSPRPETSDHKPPFRLALHLKSYPAEETLEIPPKHSHQKARSLAISYLSYRRQYEPLEGISEKKQWKQFWRDIDQYLPASPLYLDKRQRNEIKKLALLKNSLETTFFSPLEEGKKLTPFEEVQSKDLYQTLRTFFPLDNTVPLCSVWINRQPVGMDRIAPEIERPAFIYFYSLIRALLQHKKGNFVDIPFFVGRLLEIQENEELITENFEEKELLLILKSGSFSLASKGYFTIEKIFKKLSEHYKLTATKSEQLACEFFVNERRDFKVIYTSSYTVKKQGEPIGDLVAKWIVARQEGQWSYLLKIPVIDLDHSLEIKEQEEIYKAFKDFAKRE